MSDFDFDREFDRLGDVWRQQPDPAEMERLQRVAIAVANRARMAQILDVVAAIVVAAVVLFLVFSNPRLQTIAMGSAAILVLLGSNIRLRKVRQVELRSLTGSTEDMLDQSIERVETTLNHNRFTLLAMGPVLLVFILLAVIKSEQSGPVNDLMRSLPQLRLLIMAGAAMLVGGLLLYLVPAIARGKREVERLKAMREAYREESESSAQ